MADNILGVDYRSVMNKIDFSIGNNSIVRSLINDNNMDQPEENSIVIVDRSQFNILKSSSYLVDPLKLFSHLPQLPNISIFSNIFPKNNAASLDSIRNGNGAVTVSLGQVGPSVRTLQQKLTKLGFTVRDTGIFDVYTQTALKKFQASKSIEQTGALGKTTLTALDQVESKQLNRGLSTSSRFMNPDNISKFHYNQYSGLASQNGDCGPSAVKMILKANGMDASIGSIRQSAGVPRPRGGAWAISENEIKKSIEKLSGNRIKEVNRKSFNAFSHTSMINYLKSELSKGRMPVLLTANNSLTGRHYTVVVGIKNDGSILVADSARRASDNGGISTYSKYNMLKKLGVASMYGGTHIMSFEKK